jgi:hypothetical protein
MMPRRRRHGNDANLRYFLIKPGSSPAKPELGEEMASEGQAFIEAFSCGPAALEGDDLESVPGGEWRKSCDCQTD